MMKAHSVVTQIGMLALLLSMGVAAKSENQLDSVATPDSAKIMLCDDTAAVRAAKGKLVYTYIDGEKTECMSEYALTTLIAQRQFERDTAFAREQSESVMRADIIAEIQKGTSDLRGRDLRNADFMNMDLSGVDLSNAVLRGSDLRGASLKNANLSNADLRAVYFKNADLRGANLEGARLDGAYLMYADLRGATGVRSDKLRLTRSLYKTQMDSTLYDVVKDEFPRLLEVKEPKWSTKSRYPGQRR